MNKLLKSTIKKSVICCGILALLSGCAVVDPFEREYLSDKVMQFDDGDSLELMQEQHILAGREGSVGGYGVAGGGCGCN